MIFSRRRIQRDFDELRVAVLSEPQVKRMLMRLNSGSPDQALPAVWEVCVLAAFARLGEVRHEPDLRSGSAKPDLLFRSVQAPRLEFVADITAVSDRFAHSENPIRQLSRRLSEVKPAGGSLDIRVDSLPKGPMVKTKVKLLLPAEHDIEDFVRLECAKFFEQISACPESCHTFNYNDVFRGKGVRLTLTHFPNRSFGTGGHAGYDVAYSPRQNPLHNRLVRKAAQLSSTGYKGLMGIIVCDTGCHSLLDTSRVGGAENRSSIIKAFLTNRNAAKIDFVVPLVIETQTTWGRVSHILSSMIYHRGSLSSAMLNSLSDLCDRAFCSAPAVRQAPNNARHDLEGGRAIDRGAKLGMYEMGGDRITISTRTLFTLLHAPLSERDRELVFASPIHSFAFGMLRSEKALTCARVIAHPEEDDDFIEMTFETSADSVRQAQPSPSGLSCSISVGTITSLMCGVDVPAIQETQAFLSRMKSECRGIIDARVMPPGVLELTFGNPDAALGDFF